MADMPTVSTPQSPWQTDVANLRQKGASWDDVHALQAEQTDKLRKAGASEDDINSYFGQSDPAPAEQRLTDSAKAGYNSQAPQIAGNWWEDFKAGVERSSGGLVLHGQPTLQVDPQHSDFFGRLIAKTGETLGDIPAMVAGAGGGAVAGAAVPGLGETGLSEAAGLGAGAMALPQAIKSEYADGLIKGQYKGPEDFALRQAGVLWNTTKAAATGVAATVAPELLAPKLAAAGAGVATTAAVKTGASLAALTAAQAVATRQMPTAEDVADNAILLAGFKGAEFVGAKTLGPVKANVIRNWRDTGQAPADATKQARVDPVFRAQMVTPAHPDVPAGSSKTATQSGDFMLPRIANPAFDTAAGFVLQHEGAMVTDTGGLTKYGISAKAHPGVDVKSLTRDQALDLYHKEYWQPLGIDKLPANMRTAAFDSAINEGVEKTRTMLGASGGDVQHFLALRAQHYQTLAASDPAKYGQYEKGWLNRIRDLGWGGKPPPEGPKEATPGFEGADPWARIGATIAPPDKGPGFFERLGGEAYKAYTDLFNPMHPINKLTRAATEGVALPDASNPDFLYRIAELHSEHAKYNIEKNATDIDGNLTGPGLNTIIEPFRGGEYNRFWTFAKAKWASERNAKDQATGVSDEDAKAVIAEGEAKYGAAFQQLMDWQNNTAGWLKDAGVQSEAGHKAMTEDIKSRIPAYREGKQKASVGGPSAGKTAYNPLKAFEGSDARTKDPYQSLMQDAFLRSQLALYGRANLALADLAEATGLGAKAKGKAIPVKLTPDEMSEHGLDEDSDGLIWRLAGHNVAKDQVPVLRDGKLEAWGFDDPNIARVLRGYDQQTRSIFMQMALPFTKFFRASVALNPLFPVRLMTYDVPWQFITKPGMRNTLAQVYTGLGHVVGDTKTFDAWSRSGGAEKVFDNLSKQNYIKRQLAGHEDQSFADGMWNLAKTPYHALQRWGQILMQAQRVGRYAQGLKEGTPRNELAVASADAAFHRASFGGPLAKQINAVQPFTAAYLNSLEQTFRAFSGHAMTGEKIYDNKTVALNYMKAMAVVTIPMLANAAMNRDKEWYKAIPDWQKDNAMFFRFGGDGPDGFTLPFKFPPVISMLFGGIPRRMMEAYAFENPHAWDRIGSGVAGTFSPPGGFLAYNVATPIIEHIANHSFFKGHELVSDDVRNSMLPPEQASPYSTATSKAASRFVNDLPLLRNMNLSPPVIDNYIQAWGGTLGEAAVKATEHFAGANPKAPAGSIMDLPGLSSWQARYPSANAQPIQDFEERMDALHEAHGSMSAAYKNHEFDRFSQLANENPAAANMHRFRIRNAVSPASPQQYGALLTQSHASVDLPTLRDLALVERALKNQRTFVKQVYQQDAAKFSPTDKKQILDQAYSLMQIAAERGNKDLDKLGAP